MSALHRKILAVGDLHAPFMHTDAVPFLRAVKRKEKPTQIVFMGDMCDQHALSRFPRNPEGLSAGHEFFAGKRQLKPLYRLFPDAVVCMGNHDRRIYDRASEAGIPESLVRDMSEIIGTPDGWEWGDDFEIDGIYFEHGSNWSGKDAHIKAATAAMGNCVIGHIHAHAAISYISNRKYLFWGFNVGCLINAKEYAFSYARKNPSRPIIGVGIIDNGIPRFVPMLLNRRGRWTGKFS